MAKIADLYADIRANASQAIDELKKFGRAVNETEGDLDSFQEKLNKQGLAGPTWKEFQKDQQKSTDAVSNTENALASLSAKIFTVAAAYKAVRWVAQATKEYVNYSREILRVERLTGATSEESSKLIQIADRLGIETGALTTAMQQAIKRGYDPSIDGIKQMSAEYNKLGDSMSRTLYIQKHFGMRGEKAESIARLMELGPAGIEAAAAGIKQQLIFDTADMFQARQTEIMLEDLSDAYDIAKFAAGGALGSTFAQLFARDETKISKLLEYAKELNRLGVSSDVFKKQMETMAQWYGLSFTVSGDLIKTVGQLGLPIATGFMQQAILAKAISGPQKGAGRFGLAPDYTRPWISGGKLPTGEFGQLNDEMALQVGLAGDLNKIWDTFDEMMRKARKSTSRQQEAFEYLKESQEDVMMNFAQMAGAPHEAMIQLAYAFGEMDDESIAAFGAVAQLTEEAKHTNDWVAWAKKISAVNDRLAGLNKIQLENKEATYTIRVIYLVTGQVPLGTPGYTPSSENMSQSQINFVNVGPKHGGSFGFRHGGIIPPGFSNDGFLLPVSSGENVEVTPAGNKNIEGKGTNTFRFYGPVTFRVSDMKTVDLVEQLR